MRYAVGVDLGGTNVRAGLVSETGQVVVQEMRPVESSADGEGLVAQIVALVRPLMKRAPEAVLGVGIGLPAALAGPERRVLPGLSNLEGLVGYPFQKRVAHCLHLPCHLANDANLIVLGEAAFGAARGFANVLCLTLGTGIGGGLLLDGKLREGPHGVAGEIGLVRMRFHPESPLVLDAGRTPLLALEAGASAKAVGQTAGVEVEKLFAHAAAGYTSANVLLATVYEALGVAILNAHVLLDLERAVLCGGMTRAGETLRQGVEEAFQAYCPPEYRLGMEIVLGELGDTAGILGGAQLCFAS